MKTLLFLISALSCSATLYRGTISYTFTNVVEELPTLIGDTFSGFYEYDSPTPDGNFGELQFWGRISAPTWLTGYPNRDYIDIGEGMLRVENGLPTFFKLAQQPSFMSWQFNLTNFNFAIDLKVGEDFIGTGGGGTVSFSPPERVSVPDTTSSLPLLLGSVLCLTFFRRLKTAPL